MAATLRGLAAAATSALILGGGLACSTYSTYKDVAIDCTADQGYQLRFISNGASTPTDDPVTGNGNWWSAGDTLPPDGGTSNAFSTVESIENGGRCGSKTADVLHSSGFTDWGSLFGYNTLHVPAPGDYYDGLSFWARAPGDTSKGFTIILGDPNTEVGLSNYCKGYATNSGANAGTQPGTFNPATGQGTAPTNATRATYPDECGNEYEAIMLVTGDWAFYTIPFAQFQQANKPNRVPNPVLTHVGVVPGTGLLTDQLQVLLVRIPKESIMDLWLDNVAFYRKPKSNAVGMDAGSP